MKLLILGGTVFLGRHLIDAALERGHDITLFNRGQHGPDLYPSLEKLRGNRHGDVTALHGRQWDAVIDTNGFVPRAVRASAQLLADAVEHYTFISSISVYADFHTRGMDEHAPVGTITDEQVKAAESITPAEKGATAVSYAEMYGPLKALCEQTVEQVMPGRTLTIRPGLIVGPYDYSDRFTYWVRRVAQGGEVLAPGRPAFSVQMIDARDLAAWTIRMVEQRQTGTYNATGPDYTLTMQRTLETCKSVSGSDATFTWLDEPFLLESGAIPWSQIPLWIPENDLQEIGFLGLNINKALATGLTFRPLADTVGDTLAWTSTFSPGTDLSAGLKAEQEQQLLQAWHHKQATPR